MTLAPSNAEQPLRSDERERQRQVRLISDILIAVFVFVAAALVAITVDLYDVIVAFHNNIQLYEIEEFVFVAPVALAVFLLLRSKALAQEVNLAQAAEQTALAGEARQNTLAQLSAEWTWEMDADLRICWLSPQFEAVTGIAPEKLLGRDRTVLHETIGNLNLFNYLEELRARHPFHDFTYPFPDGQGQIRHFRLSGSPKWESDGSFSGYLGTGNDVTAEVNSEKQAEAARAQLSDALESSPAAIMLFDASNRLVLCNSRVLEFFPEIKYSIVPRNMWSAIVGAFLKAEFIDTAGLDYDAWMQRRLDEFRNNGEADLFQTKNGRWFNTLERPLSNGGKIRIWIDITEVKVQERKIADQAKLLQATLDNIDQGLIVSDGEQRLQLWNRHFVDLLGLAPEHCEAGKRLPEIIGQLSNWGAANRDKLAKCLLARPEEKGSRVIELTRPDGSSIDIRCNALPDGGQVTSFTDVTLQRQTEGQLRHAQKMDAVGQLTAGIAHEFNNLLTVISGFTRMAIKQPENPEHILECLSEVGTAADRAADLTRQMLAFGRKQSIESKIIRAPEFVAGLQKMLKPILGEIVTLSLESRAPAEAAIKIDQGQLTQVVVNLAINARDAMPDGGDLTIGTRLVRLSQVEAARLGVRPEKQHVALFVSDTGHGMDQSTVKRIFEPFFTTKESGKGTGLGLSVVYGIVQQMDGVIDVTSAIGKGSIFTVYLPLAEYSQDSGAQLAATDSGVGRLADLTVLVAEDEPAVQRLVVAELKTMGCRVLAASDGREAIQVQRDYSGAIDLLLTDMVMPEMGGIECARIIETERPTIKVLFMTGYASRGGMRKANAVSKNNIIQKPFTETALAQKIEEIFISDRPQLAAVDG